MDVASVETNIVSIAVSYVIQMDSTLMCRLAKFNFVLPYISLMYVLHF